MAITLSFLGAAEGVTGSRHLLEVDGAKILVDCGLFQGRREWARKMNRTESVDPATLTNVILTHGHIDHSGALPILVRDGFTGEIFCTNATADLTKILLADSGRIHESDAVYFNRRRAKRLKKGEKIDFPEIEALYTADDAAACSKHFHGVPYHHPVTIGPGITVSFTDQGHIIGSSAALITIERGGETTKIVFSGDRGRDVMPILRDPEPYPECDFILTETTYGDRTHADVGDSRESLRRIATDTFKRGGRLVIPAFSVGRTQRIIYFLHDLVRQNKLKRVPIYVDSPLASRATTVYGEHLECFDEETLEFLKTGVNPFEFDGLHYVEDVEESKALNLRTEPSIVISASGMCEAGRILHHLKHTLPHERNTILLVGYMAQHTLGRRLLDGSPSVKIFGERYKVHARVEKINGLSAHGDRDDLTGSLAHLRDRLKGIYLVHGEPDPLENFQRHLEDAGHRNVHVGRLNTTVTLVD